MQNISKAWRFTDAGPLLFLKVTPSASKDEIVGLVADVDGGIRIQVRVRAAPEKGKANKAIVKLLAKWLGHRPSDMRVEKGETSRFKQLLIVGISSQEFTAKFDALLNANT